jgi:SAM-dependent methyltransferase
MTAEVYDEDYFENGVGSNYVGYSDDGGWPLTVDVMRRFMKPESVLYEVGCAKGYFVYWAREGGFDAYGCDVSRYAIKAGVSGLRPFIQQADAQRLPWQAGSADGVCSWEVLEHMQPSTIDEVLLQMDQVVRPGGWFWHRIGIIRTDGRFPDGEDHDATHTLMHDDAWWRELFANRGYVRQVEAEFALDTVFNDRDWFGRFFVYRKPEGAE